MSAETTLQQRPTPSSPRLSERYSAVRRFTEELVAPLETEDCVIQSMPDVSPTRWHLAHTTWFFETFVLAEADSRYQVVDPFYRYLFNSYYNAVGAQFPRKRRGLLSRPTVSQVLDYRRLVDERMAEFLAEAEADAERSELEEKSVRLLNCVEIGLHHEQQHQELIVTDVKHVLSCNPMHPVYKERKHAPTSVPATLGWRAHPEGLYEIGFAGEGFSFDNEGPRHRVFLESFQIADRLATNADYLAFIEDGGYERPEFWLSAGWAAVQEHEWRAPLYWELKNSCWWNFTLSGPTEIEPPEPVCHLSYFEADAFARWSGARLPTEQEWEASAEGEPISGNFVESGALHPYACGDGPGLRQMFGDVWEWTSSGYAPYPGFTTQDGALGEYNGKFMCNQYVLRGGSCATPESHIRRTYRNFFPTDARWQFSGVRLAR